jgi:hypothetical protein
MRQLVYVAQGQLSQLQTHRRNDAGNWSSATPSQHHGIGSALACLLANRLCMPDQKTCYNSDDSRGAVQTKFVADKAANLSSGSLYAARLTQASPCYNLRHVHIVCAWMCARACA